MWKSKDWHHRDDGTAFYLLCRYPTDEEGFAFETAMAEFSGRHPKPKPGDVGAEEDAGVRRESLKYEYEQGLALVEGLEIGGRVLSKQEAVGLIKADFRYSVPVIVSARFLFRDTPQYGSVAPPDDRGPGEVRSESGPGEGREAGADGGPGEQV